MPLLVFLVVAFFLLMTGNRLYRKHHARRPQTKAPTSAFAYLAGAELIADPRYQLPTPPRRQRKKNQ